MSSNVFADVLAAFDARNHGPHAGFRPVHARGVMAAGTFVPSDEAAKLFSAPHVHRPSTPVTVRFSIDSGIPTAAENDLSAISPQGMAVRFHLADHVHTDVIGISHDGFPTRTGEEFFELMRAAAAGPPAIAAFLAAHPAAKAFVEAPKPVPASYARQAYFAVTAFKFTKEGAAPRFGRFRLRPEAGTDYLSDEQVKQMPSDFLTAELTQRLSAGPVAFAVTLQLAGEGDDATDATVRWPDARAEVAFGTITLTNRVDETAPELWKIIFDPVPRVEGIESAGDPLTAFRSDLYLMSGRRRRADKRG